MDWIVVRTWFQAKNSCLEIHLDIDNTDGGLTGAETATLTNSTVNSKYNYLVAVEDYEYEEDGMSFLQSEARIAVTNGLQTEYNKLSAQGIEYAQEYYFFGCV